MLTSAFRPGGSRAILAAWSLAPRRSWAAPASSGRSSRRSPPRGRAAARPSSWPARRASARPGSPPSSPAAPATAASQTLLGRSIDLVGTELPYQPFAEALRPLGGPRPADAPAGSQLRVFEETLALLTDHAAAAPVLLVLEDLHWADTSTLDLVVFLAHNLAERPVVLLATYRRDEPSSKGRMARLADGVRRSGSGLVLDLGPLPPEDLTALLAARAGRALTPALTDAIVARSGGNPFFAEELLAAGGDATAGLPRRLRDLLLQRVARLDPAAQDLLRLAAAAGRDVGYPLLRALAALPEPDVRDVAAPGRRARGPRRRPGRGHLPVPPRAAGRGDLRDDPARRARGAARPAGRGAVAHRGRLAGRARAALGGGGPRRRGADRLGRGGAPGGGRVRPGRGRSPTSSGRSRCGPPCPTRPGSTGLDLAGLCSWAAELASQTGASPRAAELARRAIELAGDQDPRRCRAAARATSGCTCTRTAATTPGSPRSSARSSSPAPPSAERAQALAAFGTGLHDGLAARGVTARSASRRSRSPGRPARERPSFGRSPSSAATSPTSAAARRASPSFGQAVRLAGEIGDPMALQRAYITLTDVLTMLGRPAGVGAGGGRRGSRPSAATASTHTVLVANRIEALLAIGDWDEAERASATALRTLSASYSYMALIIRADVEIGRGDFDAARAHLDAALATLREDRGLGVYDAYRAELALWERRWTDAAQAIDDGLTQAQPDEAAQIRVQLCAKGLRAQAELAALARARRDDAALRGAARPRPGAAHRRPPRRGRGRVHHAERGRLAPARPGRARPRPRRRPAAGVGGRRRGLGPARTPAAGRLLPLAPGRGAGRRGRVPRRGERAAPGRARRRGPDRRPAPGRRARAARPARPARPRPAGRRAHPARSAPWKKPSA